MKCFERERQFQKEARERRLQDSADNKLNICLCVMLSLAMLATFIKVVLG